jgi:hypothetical protein
MVFADDASDLPDISCLIADDCFIDVNLPKRSRAATAVATASQWEARAQPVAMMAFPAATILHDSPPTSLSANASPSKFCRHGEEVHPGKEGKILTDCLTSAFEVVTYPDHEGRQQSDEWSPSTDLENSIQNLQARLLHLHHSIAYVQQLKQQRMPPIAGHSQVIASGLSKREMDAYCIRLFEESPEPGEDQISTIVDAIQRRHPVEERRTTLSGVRKWFRKKREEVSLHLSNALHRYYPTPHALADFYVHVSLDDRSVVSDFIICRARITDRLSELLYRYCCRKLIASLGKQRH